MKKKSKKFRCGRAVLDKDGKIKKLGLDKGGGSRYIDLYNYSMNFEDVRDYLINLYDLGDTEDEILLYDYQLEPLNTTRYNTVSNYIRKNGLNCNSTLIYLCTRSNGDRRQNKVVKKKKKKTSLSATSVVKVEPDSDSDSQEIDLCLSSLDYSFKETTRSLIDCIRSLINQHPGDEILVGLFEKVCIIHGYICSTISSLQQNPFIQSRNSYKVLDTLNEITTISESIHNSISLNKTKLNKMKNVNIIEDSFGQFHRQFENLRNQWIEFIETNNESDEASSSSVHPTTSSSDNRFLSNNPNYSTPRRPNQETCAIFQPLLNAMTDLLDAINSQGLVSFHGMLKWIITDLEFVRSDVNLSDYQSLCNTKQSIISLKIRYTRKFAPRVFKSSVYKFTDLAKQADKKILQLMQDLLSTIGQYQLRSNENNQSSSSSDTRKKYQQKSKDHPLIPSKKIKSEQFDQMDVAIYSSAHV